RPQQTTFFTDLRRAPVGYPIACRFFFYKARAQKVPSTAPSRYARCYPYLQYMQTSELFITGLALMTSISITARILAVSDHLIRATNEIIEQCELRTTEHGNYDPNFLAYLLLCRTRSNFFAATLLTR